MIKKNHWGQLDPTVPPSPGGPDVRQVVANGTETPSRVWERRKRAQTLFLVAERPNSTGLLRILILILLLRAGINPNPGPYICPPCNTNIFRTQTIVWCHICWWIPLNYSGLANLKQPHRNFYCPICANNNIPALPFGDTPKRPKYTKTTNLATRITKTPNDPNTPSKAYSAYYLPFPALTKPSM